MPIEANLEELRFPIGQFSYCGPCDEDQRMMYISDIESAPEDLAQAVRGLSDEQLDTPYREGGWTLRQVVHHLADSHANSYVRFRLALTEDHPTIRPYCEDRWGELEDARFAPVEISLTLLSALHQRWVILLRSLESGDYAKAYFHPESKRDVSLDEALAMYAWHGKHHISHITSLRDRNGW
ncbi:MAG: bacillithiol transferase BstA [bacterium]|nr:bacillithiol transferase BstA [bacterium]